MSDGAVEFPNAADAAALGRTSDWAKPLVEAAMS